MSVQGVFGLPGVGKSTFLTACAIHWNKGKSFFGIKAKPVTFTNFYCQGCYKFNFEDLGTLYFHDCNILIDEIMLFADCRNFKNFSDSLTSFFALHRHFGVDIIWCSQYWNDCDKKIRNITDNYYLLEKSRLLPSFTFVKPIKRHLGVNTDKYILASPLDWTIIFRPFYYQHFDSHEKHVELPEPELILWDKNDIM